MYQPSLSCNISWHSLHSKWRSESQNSGSLQLWTQDITLGSSSTCIRHFWVEGNAALMSKFQYRGTTRLDDRRGGSNTETNAYKIGGWLNGKVTNAYKIGRLKGRVNVEIFPLFVVGQSFWEYLWNKNKILSIVVVMYAVTIVVSLVVHVTAVLLAAGQ